MGIKTDAQAKQSKEWLFKSLIDLMNQKAFTSISVSEIAANAGLDRRTFYRHFKRKEDILRFGLHRVANQYETMLISSDSIETRTITISLFSVCANNKNLLLLLYRHGLLSLVLDMMNILFPVYHNRYSSAEELEEPNTAYILSYHVGGFWNMLATWLADGATKTPQELASIAASFLPKRI